MMKSSMALNLLIIFNEDMKRLASTLEVRYSRSRLNCCILFSCLQLMDAEQFIGRSLSYIGFTLAVEIYEYKNHIKKHPDRLRDRNVHLSYYIH